MAETVDLQQLPDDTQTLKAMVVELTTQRVKLEEEHERAVQQQREAFEQLQEKFRILHRLHFGRSSEKLITEEDHRQALLFNEAEDGVEQVAAFDGEQAASVLVPEHRRKRPGRKAISKDLPREEIIHDLSEEQKRCPCCGKDRPLINEEASEEVDVVPAQVKVLRHLRRIYGRCDCKEFSDSGAATVVRSAMAPRMIPGGIAAPGMLAHVVTAKFVDALPFYRQETIFARLGIDVARATLCSWAIATAARCGPLIDLLWQELNRAVLIQMDETTVQVLKEHGRGPTQKSYMWVNCGYVPTDDKAEELKRIVLFHYHPTRKGEVALSVLRGYEGYLQTDGYDGYEQAGKLTGITHVACLAHIRRKFYDAAKVTKKPGSAQEALARIKKIYRIEAECRQLLKAGEISCDEFVERRGAAARPLLEKLYQWIEERIDQVNPESALGRALHYARGQWPKLLKYLDAWYLTPDNNAVEREIRPFVTGRKNWVFQDTPRGAHASAALYSLVSTARANALEPYHYLRFLFTHLPAAEGTDELRRLLPTTLTPADLLIPQNQVNSLTR